MDAKVQEIKRTARAHYVFVFGLLSSFSAMENAVASILLRMEHADVAATGPVRAMHDHLLLEAKLLPAKHLESTRQAHDIQCQLAALRPQIEASGDASLVFEFKRLFFFVAYCEILAMDVEFRIRTLNTIISPLHCLLLSCSNPSPLLPRYVAAAEDEDTASEDEAGADEAGADEADADESDADESDTDEKV